MKWMSLVATFSLVLGFEGRGRAEEFRVRPYLQNPTTEEISIRWLSNSEEPGIVTVNLPEGPQELRSQPKRADALAYNPVHPEPGGPHPKRPFLHRVRVRGLRAGTRYSYHVRQGREEYKSTFQTAPPGDTAIRFLVYSDPETEPESTTSPPVDWPAPAGANRPDGLTKYLVDQTKGYRENCRLMASRKPDFICIAGDLVETGGEQRDWDEFWRHNAGDYGTLAGAVPFFPSLGNHENYAGAGGGYTAPAADFATEKYRTYFEVPANKSAKAIHEGRYYRIDYGPITLIVLDSSDGLPDKTQADTNFNLEGSHAPDFNPGSEQYRWFERQLSDAQRKSQFTFVQFHHTAYGSGPHSIPFGHPNFSGQSGIAMRAIVPLLFRYGVDAVLSGHDEMLERSLVSGTESLPDGKKRPHSIHFFDVGIGGDGLRGPSEGFDNPYRQFLAHENAPEKWEGLRLVSGGKHYGHLEINVAKNAQGIWEAVIEPVCVFPLMNAEGAVTGWERRVYDDVITLTADSGMRADVSSADGEDGALPAETAPRQAGLIAVVLLAGLAGGTCISRRLRSIGPQWASFNNPSSSGANPRGIREFRR